MRLPIRWSITSLLIAVLFVCAACQTETPTVVYIVLSPTPSLIPVTPTPEMVAAITAESETETPTNTTPNAITAQPTIAAAARTDLPPGFPTPVVARIQIVEQLFERGRMFWLEPNREIWVLLINGEGRGTWAAYEDSWSLTPR